MRQSSLLWEKYEKGQTETGSGLLGAEQGFDTKEGEPEEKINQSKAKKQTKRKKD